MQSLSRYMVHIKLVLLFVIFFVACYQRISLFDGVGKDIYAHERAITDLVSGINPYIWTIESYSNPDDPGNHGYAYLPGLMYINTPLFLVGLKTGIPFQYLWKIPVLLADLGVGILIYKELSKKSSLAALFGLVLWFFNPYFYLKNNYVYTDPLPIFFMLLSLYYMRRDSVISGASFAFSVALKTFPIILLPIFIFKSKNLKDFVGACALIAVGVSLPFMRSLYDLETYLLGSLFVHGERFIQGRPFLFYISYYYDVELFQIISFKTYTYLATLGAWIALVLAYFAAQLRDKYVLGLVPFLVFYTFTPVLNRTYLLWGFPVIILGFSRVFKKHFIVYYVLLFAFWGFYYWYLLQWKDGFHIWHP